MCKSCSPESWIFPGARFSLHKWTNAEIFEALDSKNLRVSRWINPGFMSFMARQWGLKIPQQRWSASCSGKIWKERPCISCVNFSFVAVLFQFKPLHFYKIRIGCWPQVPMFCKYVTQLCDFAFGLPCFLPHPDASQISKALKEFQAMICWEHVVRVKFLWCVWSREWTRWSMAAALMLFCDILC